MFFFMFQCSVARTCVLCDGLITRPTCLNKVKKKRRPKNPIWAVALQKKEAKVCDRTEIHGAIM
jgi:hypothetical protein